jgi:hypothetical protein
MPARVAVVAATTVVVVVFMEFAGVLMFQRGQYT